MDKLKLVFVMILWGSVGLLAKSIPLSSSLLAFCRAALSVIVLLSYASFKREQILKVKKKEYVPLFISGIFIGLAWFCLFEAFKSTSIATATLTYNMCPVYILLLSQIVLKERMRFSNVLNVIVAFIGLYFILKTTTENQDIEVIGVIYGLLSGLMYAIIVLINRKVSATSSSTITTLIQMTGATLVMVFVIIFQRVSLNEVMKLNIRDIMMLLMLGCVHTSVGFLMYFSATRKISAISTAIISYFEPVMTFVLAVAIMKEAINKQQIMGITLILGSTILAEVAPYIAMNNNQQKSQKKRAT